VVGHRFGGGGGASVGEGSTGRGNRVEWQARSRTEGLQTQQRRASSPPSQHVEWSRSRRRAAGRPLRGSSQRRPRSRTESRSSGQPPPLRPPAPVSCCSKRRKPGRASDEVAPAETVLVPDSTRFSSTSPACAARGAGAARGLAPPPPQQALLPSSPRLQRGARPWRRERGAGEQTRPAAVRLSMPRPPALLWGPLGRLAVPRPEHLGAGQVSERSRAQHPPQCARGGRPGGDPGRGGGHRQGESVAWGPP